MNIYNSIQPDHPTIGGQKPRKGESGCITMSTLKKRGWTDSLAAKILGEPDSLARNPHYVSAGAPMRLYKPARVEAAEQSPAFIAHAAKRAAKSKVQ